MKQYMYLLVVILIIVGCSRQVQRIDENTIIDLSGRWNDTDSRLVAEEMVKDGLSRPWLINHVESKGQRPTIIVGLVMNKTHELINTETFIREIEREFLNSGKIRLQGVINSIVDTYNNKRVVNYQVDLELSDLENNEKVWIGTKSIRKFITN